jgi:D-glycero-D-manno-heptose 1,7-bisphosphate phosphatase
LAGGKGTRISEIYPDVPKPMINVLGKPLLQWQIESLCSQGIKDITLITGYKSEVIRDYFGSGKAFGVDIEYIVEQSPLGTGGALCLLPKEETLVIFGDLYFDIDFCRFIGFHKKINAGVTLFAHPNSHPFDSDIVVTDSDSLVTGWKSKKDSARGDLRNMVNAGMYIFSKECLPKGDPKRLDLEQDIILPAIPKGNIYAYRSTEYIKDMGTPKRLEEVERNIKNGAASAKNLRNKQQAVFLDRDGTINTYEGFIRSPNQIHLIPGAGEAIRRLNESPFLSICVTNQPVIARGDVTFDGLNAIHAALDTLLGQEGAYLDDLFFCPHHPDKGFKGEIASYKTDCLCRKPKPGMIFNAMDMYNIDLEKSFMIGDSTVDISAGYAAGCKTIGVRTGLGLSDKKHNVNCDYYVKDILEAVHVIGL